MVKDVFKSWIQILCTVCNLNKVCSRMRSSINYRRFVERSEVCTMHLNTVGKSCHPSCPKWAGRPLGTHTNNWDEIIDSPINILPLAMIFIWIYSVVIYQAKIKINHSKFSSLHILFFFFMFLENHIFVAEHALLLFNFILEMIWLKNLE